MLGLLSMIIRGREQSYQEGARHRKIALASEHTDNVDFCLWSLPY